ncbi:MAG: hypothetical protein K1X74_15520 [Pirellulales bacterium]|nr:hypothetical protein [Pirellulales bacterium]
MRGSVMAGVLVLAAAGLAGCARPVPLGEVTGTLTIAGEPAARILVQFLPDASAGTVGPRSSGMTDERGHFALRCDDRRPGAVVGRHRVVCEDLLLYNRPRNEVAPTEISPFVSRVPARYGDAQQTPLQVEVGPAPQNFALEVLVDEPR